MADRYDQTMTGRKRHSKGKGKGEKEMKTPDGKGDKARLQEITADSVETFSKDNTKEASVSALKQNVTKVDEVGSDAQKKSTKSREEILAEREAKKLAKQALKKKAKDKESKQTVNETKKEEVPQKGSDVKENALKKPDDKCATPVQEVKELVEQVVQPSDTDKTENKSKSQLRAERRAKQEAQRAKKMEKAQGVTENKVKPVPDLQSSISTPVKENKIVQPSQKVHKVKLFAHLYGEVFDCIEMELNEDIHPCIVRLGTQYRSKVISGANARCLALLNTFKTLIQDYETPLNQELSRGLEAEISKSVSFLNKCRPIAVSMTNAIKHLKYQVNQIKGTESKKQITDWIDTYIKEQIEKASEAVSLFVLEKITDGDVILTYSCSSLIQRILLKANEAGIKFRVIVVDGRPWLEGKEMLRRLVKAGISCTYVLFNGLSFIMPEVTKVLLGAHALLANGYVMSRAGSSQIALLAKTYNVPVLVCCETHKFSEKVQTDSFVYNELGDPDELISNKGPSKELSKWKTLQYLTPLNLTYDVTPPDLVSAVVTEIAVLPCTSVPVILRVKPQDLTC